MEKGLTLYEMHEKKRGKDEQAFKKVKISRFFKGNESRNKDGRNLKKKEREQITVITVTERQLTDQEDDCVRELNAFARGGQYAMDILQKVYKNILEKYGVPMHDTHEILTRAGLYLDTFYSVRLLHKNGAVEDDDEEEEEESMRQACIDAYFIKPSSIAGKNEQVTDL